MRVEDLEAEVEEAATFLPPLGFIGFMGKSPNTAYRLAVDTAAGSGATGNFRATELKDRIAPARGGAPAAEPVGH